MNKRARIVKKTKKSGAECIFVKTSQKNLAFGGLLTAEKYRDKRKKQGKTTKKKEKLAVFV